MAAWQKVSMTLVITALAIAGMPAFAQQSDDELAARMHEAENRLKEQQVAEAAGAAEQRARAAGERAAQTAVAAEDVEVRLREAEQRLAEAARQVADLSMSQLPRVERIERVIRAGRGPVLGITIGRDEGADDSNVPVAGVEILGVTPGGAAGEAGLRAGDVITSINGENLMADSDARANEKLLDFMRGVESGDVLTVEYLRNGKSAKADITPRPIENNVFAFEFDGNNFTMPGVPMAPDAPHFRNFGNFIWMTGGDGFGDMELVKLTERLGSYFGTSEGLLVVRAPKDENLKLEDGDVILNIDGRSPTSVSHAMRILGSYQGGETLKIEVMRDRKKRTVEIEVPDNRRSSVPPAVAPVRPLSPPKAVIIERERM